MSWHLKRSLVTATLDRYPVSFKEDRERSSSLSRRPVRPFLRRPSTNGIILQTSSAGSGSAITNLAVCVPDHPRITRSRSRSSEALIPWKQPRRHSFSGQAPAAIQTQSHALALFQTSRGHQRGVGISTNPFAMDIPDLSLRSTFSPPFHRDPSTTTPCMCKYTIYNLDCGHPAEDHVDTRGCPHFQRTGVPCDRENPANRSRVNIRSEDRRGLCKNCLRQQREQADLEELAKQQSLAEARERERMAKEQEAKLYKESAAEYERQRREREQADIEYMLKKSREEDETRHQREMDDLAKALAASRASGPQERNVSTNTVTTHDQKEVEGGTLFRTRIDSTTITETRREMRSPEPIPPPPPRPAQLPSPPQTPVRANPPPRTPPTEKPAAPVDFSLPVGQQDYGAYTLGGRRQPIHESQRRQAATYLKSPATPSTPAPVARLSSTVQPKTPSPRQFQPSPAPVPLGDLRSGLRRTGGPRQSLPPRTASGEENELQAHLARRRTWEPKDDTSSNASITPLESASNRSSRVDSPTGSEVGRGSTTRNSSSKNHEKQ